METNLLSNEELLAILIGPKTAAKVYHGHLAPLVFGSDDQVPNRKLVASMEFAKRLMRENLCRGPVLTSPAAVSEYLTAHFLGKEYDALEEQKFDLIVSNPPFVANPKTYNCYIHSDGGFFGTKVIEKIFKSLPEFLHDTGRVYLVALSLAGKANSRVQELLLESRKFKNTLIYDLYKSSAGDFGRYLEIFGCSPDSMLWRKEISELGYGSLVYSGIFLSQHTLPDNPLQDIARKCLPSNSDLQPWQSYCWSMSNRLKRYKTMI